MLGGVGPEACRFRLISVCLPGWLALVSSGLVSDACRGGWRLLVQVGFWRLLVQVGFWRLPEWVPAQRNKHCF